MKLLLPILIVFLLFGELYRTDGKEAPKEDKAYYKKKHEDPIIKEIEEAESLTSEVRKRQEEEQKKRKGVEL